jgi:hypothetical protein
MFTTDNYKQLPTRPIQSLTCPQCGGPLTWQSGERLATCSFCGQLTPVQDEQSLRRRQVLNQVPRSEAKKALARYLQNVRMSPGWQRAIRLRDLFLIYVPFWCVEASVGLPEGRSTAKRNGRQSGDVVALPPMQWTTPATDPSEFGVRRVRIDRIAVEPYDAQRLHSEGLVFEPTEPESDMLARAETHFEQLLRLQNTPLAPQSSLKDAYLTPPELSLVYYPLWVARYDYHGRNYQVVLDGLSSVPLYGKVPGNVFVRAASLVGAMAGANLFLAAALVQVGGLPDSLSSAFVFLVVFATCGLLAGAFMWVGYRTFRYGGEVATMDPRDALAEGKAVIGGKYSV